MDNLLPISEQRGSELLLAHLQSLDPEAPNAQDRLKAELGYELAHKLLFALAPHRSRHAA